jgi:hypothetical protein
MNYINFKYFAKNHVEVVRFIGELYLRIRNMGYIHSSLKSDPKAQ